jgi:hypothetical protein
VLEDPLLIKEGQKGYQLALAMGEAGSRAQSTHILILYRVNMGQDKEVKLRE